MTSTPFERKCYAYGCAPYAAPLHRRPIDRAKLWRGSPKKEERVRQYERALLSDAALTAWENPPCCRT
jgi:hypothetical protein